MGNHREEALKLATRANELLSEICLNMLSLSYLWDEVQGHYYEDDLYAQMEDALNKRYPFVDSYDVVCRKVHAWALAVSEELDTIFAQDFVGDAEKMADFIVLSKKEFLDSYSYLNEAEYEATRRRILSLAKEAKA